MGWFRKDKEDIKESLDAVDSPSEYAPRGVPLDFHTGLAISGEPSFRDKPGREFALEREKAIKRHITQKQFAEYLQNPDFYCLTDCNLRRSFHPRGSINLTDLHFAVFDDDKKSVIRLLLQDSTPDELDKYGRTPLMYAVVERNLDIVDALLRYKPDVNLQDKNGCTALHFAAMYECLDIAEHLISQSAIVDVRDAWGNTPFWRAAYTSNIAMGQLLLANGADWHVKNKYGISAWDMCQ